MYCYRQQTKLRKGNDFTHVCDSVNIGSLSSGGSVQWGVSVQGGLCQGDPHMVQSR